MKCALANEVERLLEQQIAAWPLLARGVQGLRNHLTRTVIVGGHELLLRHIPHRLGSTTAPVDRVSVERRPCFLCAANLPPEQIGIPFESGFSIYCNPYPILDRHLTIIGAEHRLQRIAGNFPAFLRLAEALPEYFFIYNGSECGASAPDHLHFQGCSRSVFPIEQDTRELKARYMPDYGRRVLVFRDREASRLVVRLEDLMAILAEVVPRAGEPMVNIAAFHQNGEWTVFVFPRGKHRPRVFETGELTVSPGTIDLCGVFVVPVLKDFERISGKDVELIFEEVTLPAEAFREVLARLEADA